MHPSYSQPALIAIGAALGALLRWQLGLRFNPLFAQFAFGTWLANLLGCLLAGTVLGLLLAGKPLSRPLQHALAVGFLGSLTTFSTFAAELVQLSQRQQWQNVFTALLLHLGGGVGAVVLGAWLVGKMAR